MEDQKIVDLYWARSEEAIAQTEKQYGSMLHRLALSLLRLNEDAQECVSDTYLAAWGAMPTDRPSFLGAYLSKITRRLAIDRYRAAHAQKRSGITVCIDELAECLPSRGDVFDAMEGERLKSVINRFLGCQTEARRQAFLLRYYAGQDIASIASRLSMSEGNVKVTLHRMRAELRSILEREELM